MLRSRCLFYENTRISVHIPGTAPMMTDWLHSIPQHKGNIMTLEALIRIPAGLCVCACEWAPTRILPSFISVDKAGDQHNECEESDGTQQPNKPALRGYSSMDAGQTWGEQYPVTLTHLDLFVQTLDWMFTSTKPIWCKGRRWQGKPVMEIVQYKY